MLQTLERCILDPISEAPPYMVTSNRPLEITGLRAPSPAGHGIFLVDHQYPRPEMISTFAGSRDSQGEKRFGKPKFNNRKIPITAYVTEHNGIGSVTNLATNPDGEILKKFSDGPDYVNTRQLGGVDEVPSLSGEYRDKHAFDGSASDSNMGFLGFTLPGAGTYTFSVFVWIPTSWDGSAPVVALEGWVGGSLKAQTPADLNLRDQWQRISSTIQVVAGDLIGTLVIRAITPPTSIAKGIMYSDALQIEVGSVTSPFLMGDTPGCFWTGTPHASTSTRVGSGTDRKRFIRSLYDLQEKIEKLAEEGGTYKRVLPDGSWIMFDVIEASFVGNWEKRFNQGQEEFKFELVCSPGARLSPITYTAHEEKTLAMLSFEELNIPGDLPALGDMVIEDTQGVNRNFVAMGLASRTLDKSENAKDFYEAESRLRLAGATLATGGGVPSGAVSNNVVNCPLFEEYTPYLSSRSSAGVYTTHLGLQRMYARVWLSTANAGDVTLRAEYSQGDLLRWRPLDAISLAGAAEGGWFLVDLGAVRIDRAVIGAQRWEGRVTAKSTIGGDVVLIDYIAIMPAEEFFGEAFALTVPASVVGPQIARDNFSQSGPAGLTGKVATAGGTWSGAGDADDMVVNGTGQAYRNVSGVDVSGAANDPSATFGGTVTGRYMRLGVGTQAGVFVSCDVDAPSLTTWTERRGILARYTDTNNLVMGWLEHYVFSDGTWHWQFRAAKKKEGGEWSILANGGEVALSAGAIYNISMFIATDGSGWIQLKSGNSVVGFKTWVANADLATGGKLATGGYGLYNSFSRERNIPAGGAGGGYYDNFSVRAVDEPLVDAAMYANRDLRIRWDDCLRESNNGVAFSRIGRYHGDRLLIPQSGREGRPVRFSILASRGLPRYELDPQADDIKATLTVTPRVIEVPEPS